MKERDMVHPTDRELSRRSFLKGTVLAGAGVGAMGALAACAPSGAKDDLASTGVAADSVTWDKETDIVVVGFGGAGSAAAIEARKAGAEVVILEASSVGGGSTALNGGLIYLGGTPLQKEHGIEDSAENFLNYMMQMAGPSANVDALKLIAEQSEDIYNWCLEQGIDFSGEVLEAHLPDGEEGICLGYTGNELSREAQKVATPAPRGHVAQPEATGMGFFRPLKAAVEGSGAEVLYEAVATSLITDENGRVIGVCADYDGGSKNVKANKRSSWREAALRPTRKRCATTFPTRPIPAGRHQPQRRRQLHPDGPEDRRRSQGHVGNPDRLLRVHDQRPCPAKASWSMKTGCALPPKTEYGAFIGSQHRPARRARLPHRWQ